MTQFSGQIALVNVKDGEGKPGTGIESTKIYYGISSSADQKPLEWIEWTEGTAIPSAGKGEFLWTKTTILYTNKTYSTYYTYSYQGQNGAPGKDGTPGKDGAPGKDGGSRFFIKTNQNEILKFLNSKDEMSFSPQLLTIQVMEGDPKNPSGEKEIENILLDNLDVSVFSKENMNWVPLKREILGQVVTLSNNTFKMDLLKMASNYKKDPEVAIFITSESTFQITYHYTILETETKPRELYNIESLVNFRYGMNKDMASLSLSANGIVSSIQSTSLTFNANGLSVKNGSINIVNNNGEPVLTGDSSGNLQLTGKIKAVNSTFSGELIAAKGSFSGEIVGASGMIGGFKIGPDKLESLAQESNIPNVILNGKDGHIYAKNITLGKGARIEEYIQLGGISQEDTALDQKKQFTILLAKPISETDSFIRVTAQTSKIDDTNKVVSNLLKLTANGNLELGSGQNTIIANGSRGYIESQNYINGLGWRISNEGAYFNNIVAKGSIKASVMEYGETSAVGGILVVRPSTKINFIEPLENKTKIFVETTKGFFVNDWCRVTPEGGEPYYFQIASVEKDYLLANLKMSNIEGHPIVDFGRTGSIGIGINGSNDTTLLPSNSISVFQFEENGKNLTPKIVLGKLPDEPNYGYARGTYGLYAENVLLKGSLVTETTVTSEASATPFAEDGSLIPTVATYSGISTLYSGANTPTSTRYSKWFGEGNTGEILLWAGADGTSKDEIEKSKFFVDRRGNLFAGSGYFKGTIITDATITASKIETAELRGSGAKPALTIGDAKNGIVFKGTTQGEPLEKKLFELTSEYMNVNLPQINFNKGLTINEQGKLTSPEIIVLDKNSNLEKKQALLIRDHKIGYSSDFEAEGSNGVENSYIDFKDGISFFTKGVKDNLVLNQQNVQVNSTLLIEGAVNYNDLIKYQPVYSATELIGYDLYIEKKGE